MRRDRFQPLAEIRREYEAARMSLAYFVASWAELVNTVNLRRSQQWDFRDALRNLERTYTIRLFSQFEAILRDYLREEGRRVPRIAENLINRVAAMRQIDPDILETVHAVREYRNALVHDAAAPAEIVIFDVALTALNRFIGWLP